ncbi:MAG TPA: hypothetical protein VF520_08475 [Thermoleophilaceae bacterium]|jgi:hypothetical protein
MRRTILVTAAVAAAVALLAPAGASATIWDGSCSMDAVVETPEYNVVPQNRDFYLTAKGTCTGKVDGKSFNGPAGAIIDGRMDKPMSCFFGISNQVPGVVYFGSQDPNDMSNSKIDVTVEIESHIGTNLLFDISGAYNGTAIGRLVFNVGVADGQHCFTDKLEQVTGTFDNQTITPLYG